MESKAQLKKNYLTAYINQIQCFHHYLKIQFHAARFLRRSEQEFRQRSNHGIA